MIKKIIKRGRPSTGATSIIRLRVQPGRKARYQVAAGKNLSKWITSTLDKNL